MIRYQRITHADIGPILRLGLIMHQESPVYGQFEPNPEYAENLCKHLIDTDQFGNLAYDDNQLVGLMLGHTSYIPWTKELAAFEIILYVLPSHRDGIIGVRLIRSFENWALDKHINYVIMGISIEINSAMVSQMYERLGYHNYSSTFRKYLQ